MKYIAVTNDYIAHHGIKGQKWGVRNGPPYPLSRQTDKAGISGGKMFSAKKGSSDDFEGLSEDGLQRIAKIRETTGRVNGAASLGADGSFKAATKAFRKLPRLRQTNCGMCTLAGISSHLGYELNAKEDFLKDDPGTQEYFKNTNKSYGMIYGMTKTLFRQILPGVDKTEQRVDSAAEVIDYIKKQGDGKTGAIMLPLEMHGLKMPGAHWVQWTNIEGKAYIADNQAGVLSSVDSYLKDSGRTMKAFDTSSSEATKGSIFTVTEDMIRGSKELSNYTQ